MIYFDNSATTLQKPPAVAEAVADAIKSLGNPNRSFCGPAMDASRAVFRARQEVAKLVGLKDPLCVAFTSGATESLNLVLNSLIRADDGVITSVLEHNSVLRPLYRIGCPLSFINCDDNGMLDLDALPKLLNKNTRFLVCAHGSNLLGSIADVRSIYAFCKDNGLTFILDAAQTLGSVETLADMADVLCFTGHKALFGPQGTGGIIAAQDMGFRLTKTGGSGVDSFERFQQAVMPDIFEAGTQNAHGLAGLAKGVEYVNAMGIDEIARVEGRLREAFIARVSGIPGVRLYGCGANGGAALPIVALNVADIPSGEVAMALWEKWGIVVRSGSHCAPLAHERFNTKAQGMVRFSFSIFNTIDEIEAAVSALADIAAAGQTHGG